MGMRAGAFGRHGGVGKSMCDANTPIWKACTYSRIRTKSTPTGCEKPPRILPEGVSADDADRSRSPTSFRRILVDSLASGVLFIGLSACRLSCWLASSALCFGAWVMVG